MTTHQTNGHALLTLLEQWLHAKEGEHFEFKEARNEYSFDKLATYCCALANEGGGRIILGVSDKRPRKVVGSLAFPQPEETRRSLCEKLRLRIDFQEIVHPNGRVLVFEVPSRPVGIPMKYDGVYWSRENDSLVPINEERLRDIFNESGHDFSADICPSATLADLEQSAIDDFRKRWTAKSGNEALNRLAPEQLLRDVEAVTDSGVTFAALILFGTRQALRKHLAQSELVFEYRSSDESGPAQQRKEYQSGFFTYYDDLWNTINLRNDLQHYQNGFFVLDIPTFDERSVREAVLNAVSHRDYRLGSNIFVRQYSRRIIIESPGGFPAGITPENVLDRQYPRNRRIAEIFARCGLVERAGQGMNLIFEQAIRKGKLPPDFTGSDKYQLYLTLQGQVRDEGFIRFIETIVEQQAYVFSAHDLLIIDFVHRGLPIPDSLDSRVPVLVEHGILEKSGKGRGTKYILSRQFYRSLGKAGVYTRKRGLDKETNKALLLKHVTDNGKIGSPMKDLLEVLPALSRRQIQRLLDALEGEGMIELRGKTKAGLWFPKAKPSKKDLHR
jgi:ATP-dependent DNA helicase RecG